MLALVPTIVSISTTIIAGYLLGSVGDHQPDQDEILIAAKR